jgi:hypothetical protein
MLVYLHALCPIAWQTAEVLLEALCLAVHDLLDVILFFYITWVCLFDNHSLCSLGNSEMINAELCHGSAHRDHEPA